MQSPMWLESEGMMGIDRGLEIATEAAGLITVLAQLAQQALAANDPSSLRRVREVITGELAVEGVLRDGEEKARALAGGQ